MIFIMSLTSESQEQANVTRWARMRGARLVGLTRRGMGVLRHLTGGDTLVIVAHGCADSIGTAHDAVTYTPASLYETLSPYLAGREGLHLDLACCSCQPFADELQNMVGNRIMVTGRDHDWAFGPGYNPADYRRDD